MHLLGILSFFTAYYDIAAHIPVVAVLNNWGTSWCAYHVLGLMDRVPSMPR